MINTEKTKCITTKNAFKTIIVIYTYKFFFSDTASVQFLSKNKIFMGFINFQGTFDPKNSSIRTISLIRYLLRNFAYDVVGGADRVEIHVLSKYSSSYSGNLTEMYPRRTPDVPQMCFGTLRSYRFPIKPGYTH